MRAATALFALLCTAGSAASVGLVVHEARRREPVVADVVASSRDGLTSTVEVRLRNRTAGARCVTARVLAQARDGRDLAAADLGAVRLPGTATTSASARLTLPASDYRERLTGFRVTLSPCHEERGEQK